MGAVTVTPQARLMIDITRPYLGPTRASRNIVPIVDQLHDECSTLPHGEGAGGERDTLNLLLGMKFPIIAAAQKLLYIQGS